MNTTLSQEMQHALGSVLSFFSQIELENYVIAFVVAYILHFLIFGKFSFSFRISVNQKPGQNPSESDVQESAPTQEPRDEPGFDLEKWMKNLTFVPGRRTSYRFLFACLAIKYLHMRNNCEKFNIRDPSIDEGLSALIESELIKVSKKTGKKFKQEHWEIATMDEILDTCKNLSEVCSA